MFTQIKTAIIFFIVFTILTGIIYPFAVTGIAQLCFPWRANGSMLEANGKIIGSKFIGQPFSDKKYFWGRPSATTPYPYNGANSSGSNSGPSNPAYLTLVKSRIETLKKNVPHPNLLIPVDLVTASASGLDPEISPLAAFYQVPRIASERGVCASLIRVIIQSQIHQRTMGLLGEPRVNVLKLNLALDNLKVKHARTTTP